MTEIFQPFLSNITSNSETDVWRESAGMGSRSLLQFYYHLYKSQHAFLKLFSPCWLQPQRIVLSMSSKKHPDNCNSGNLNKLERTWKTPFTGQMGSSQHTLYSQSEMVLVSWLDTTHHSPPGKMVVSLFRPSILLHWCFWKIQDISKCGDE